MMDEEIRDASKAYVERNELDNYENIYRALVQANRWCKNKRLRAQIKRPPEDKECPDGLNRRRGSREIDLQQGGDLVLTSRTRSITQRPDTTGVGVGESYVVNGAAAVGIKG